MKARIVFICALWVLLGGALQGQTYLHLRYGAGPKITVTGASNSTPIQITTSTDHGFSPGDVVWIWGISGNWNADGTRIVKEVQDSRHFTIQYMDGTDAVGNGTFSAMMRIGAWVGSTVAYPLTAHPRLWLDGPNGTLTARMKDPDGPGGATAPRAQGGNPPWDSLSSWLDGNIKTNYQWNGSNFSSLSRRHLCGGPDDGAAVVRRQFANHVPGRRCSLDRERGEDRGDPGLR